MRQVASGFAIGSFSITMLVVPFVMMALNIAPSYTSAIGAMADRSGVTEPLQAASAQIEHYRYELMQPVLDLIGHRLFPMLPKFPDISH